MNCPPFLVNLEHILTNAVDIDDPFKINLSANNKYTSVQEKQFSLEKLIFNEKENYFMYDLNEFDLDLGFNCDIVTNFKVDNNNVSFTFSIDNLEVDGRVFTWSKFALPKEKKQKLCFYFKNIEPKDFKLTFDCIFLNYETKKSLSFAFRIGNIVYYDGGVYKILYHDFTSLQTYLVENKETKKVFAFIGE